MPRRIVRLLILAAVLAWSILEALILRPRTRSQRAAWLSRIARRVLRAESLTVTAVGAFPTHGAVIANHLTYLDIAFLTYLRPCVFVSKIELRTTPILGWISMMAGSIYIDRKAGRSAIKASQGMARDFHDGLPVVFFPEGTTGVGDTPTLPFRNGLLSLTLATGQPITAAFIHYELTPLDLAHGKSTRNDVHWGNQSLFQHIWNFADLHEVHGVIQFASQPIVFSKAALQNRKIAAQEAQAAVEALAVPIQEPTVASR